MLKIAAVMQIIRPLLASDSQAETLKAAIIAADKKARDENSGMGPKELEKTDRESAMDAREADCDMRESTMDASEEEADKGKEEQAAKDRKAARDARKGARDSRKAARDARKKARDENPDPEHTNDEDLASVGDPSTPGGSRANGKTAVDSAEVDRRIKEAVETDRIARDALYTAREDVRPTLGIVTMDSAEAVYRAGLDKLGIDHKDLPAAALRKVFTMARDHAAALAEAPATGGPALDSAGATSFAQAVGGYGRLK